MNAHHGGRSEYASKRDAWVTALIWGGAALCVFFGVAQLGSAAGTVAKLDFLLPMLATAGFLLWVLHDIGYRLTSDELQIHSGPFRMRVPLAEIDSIEPSRNPVSSPAASLDRLSIRWDGRRRVLISPEAKLEFVAALVARAPHLVQQGERAERRKT